MRSFLSCNCIAACLVILISVLPGILGVAFFTVNIVNLGLILNRTFLHIMSGTDGIRFSVIGFSRFLMLG